MAFWDFLGLFGTFWDFVKVLKMSQFLVKLSTVLLKSNPTARISGQTKTPAIEREQIPKSDRKMREKSW